ncbi:MAG: hypothetical protein H6867_00950 [Rhodospirillales bacterium]|nr:hypothetical protein [Rhodospirillales bacterium]MCB9996770.1 hypothetical protein [Rhodospirillales bacterium]
MKRTTKWMIAGTLTGVFAVGAGLWSLYPENRQIAEDFARANRILPAAPLPPAQPRYFVTAGQNAAPSAYMPDAAIQGTSADGQSVRLIYRAAITADAQRETLLSHPRIDGDEEKYTALRRDAIATSLQARWQSEIGKITVRAPQTDLDFTAPHNAARLQNWLEQAATDLHETEGLDVSFKVNTVNALDILTPAKTPDESASPQDSSDQLPPSSGAALRTEQANTKAAARTQYPSGPSPF